MYHAGQGITPDWRVLLFRIFHGVVRQLPEEISSIQEEQKKKQRSPGSLSESEGLDGAWILPICRTLTLSSSGQR